MDRVVRRAWEPLRVPFECVGESMTEQSHRDSVDINTIVLRHARTGGIPVPDSPLQYLDVTRLQEDLMARIGFSEALMRRVFQFLDAEPGQVAAVPAEPVVVGTALPDSVAVVPAS